ncbi:winged helix-turn-helix transcriptional regulator [Kitasatospora sp. NPDC097605]|uniref:winged helix-turn-helix transcriptional regulator n=1 Tax=Kitasatospora sp. NPDC097605 TaxID=3157226 RepID=UPI00332B1CC2
MPTAPSPLAQAQHIQAAISVLGPPNTISLLRLLKLADGTRPLSELADKSRGMTDAQLERRLDAMEENGLITRSQEAGTTFVSATRAGREAVACIQIPVTRWSSAHQGVPEHGTGPGAYTEQALGTLNRTNTVATVMALAAYGEPAYPSEILDDALPAAMNPSNLYLRLQQLEADGLVERTGEPRNYMYGLTTAGKALADPLQAISRWAQRHLPKPPRADTTVRRADARSTAPAASSPAARPAAVGPSPAAPARAGALVPAAPGPVAVAQAVASPSQQAAARAKAASLRSATSALVFSDQAPAQPTPVISNSTAAKRR